jgi:hypothetical protein
MSINLELFVVYLKDLLFEAWCRSMGKSKARLAVSSRGSRMGEACVRPIGMDFSFSGDDENLIA